MKQKFYSFNAYLRKIFGEKVQRISIDAGFNCPNIDGKLSSSGCIYCNNKGFGVYAQKNMSIEQQIGESIEFYSKRLGIKKFIAYFQSFAGTYAPPQYLKKTYDIVKKFSQIAGIFISTRPDCVDEEKIRLISRYSDDYLVWIEYGLQTTRNHILKAINRNHTYEDFLKSLELTRKYGINTGVHCILGLPGATYEDMMEDSLKLAKLDIQGIKFHLLHVLRDTALEKMYEEKKVKLLEQDEYVKIICDFLENIPSAVVILRLISSAPENYLIAPLWMNRKAQILENIEKEFEARGTYQGYRFK